MKTQSLGATEMFGGKHHVTYNNEAIQIGYRLGKILNTQEIYAIDDDTIIESIVTERANEELNKKYEQLNNVFDFL